MASPPVPLSPRRKSGIWPDGANMYVLRAHSLSKADGELFVHSGMALVIRPPGSPTAYASYKDKITAVFTTPQPHLVELSILSALWLVWVMTGMMLCFSVRLDGCTLYMI